MTPAEATEISDLRLHILRNIQQGLPPETGLDRDKLKAAIAICRADYTAAQSKSKASGVTDPSKPAGPAIDLAAIFTNKKS
jgi:hypothetical protein